SIRDRSNVKRRWWPFVAGGAALIALVWAGSQYNKRPLGPPESKEATPIAVVQPGLILRLDGPDTIGEKLAPMVGQAYLAGEGDGDIQVREGPNSVERTVFARDAKSGGAVAIDLKAHGSATAFTDLEAGAADVGMASRPINSAEIERLKPKLGDLSQPGAEH